MLSKKDDNKKAALATLALTLLSLSVASSVAIGAPYYATAQVYSGQGGGGSNATNAATTSGGNATNATGAAGGNATTSASIVSGASSLTDTAYQPNPLQVSVGSTVTWTNNDSQPHTVTSGSNGQPDNKFNSSPNFTPLLNPGQTFEHTFTEAGEYPYFCLVHPNMVGTVSVK